MIAHLGQDGLGENKTNKDSRCDPMFGTHGEIHPYSIVWWLVVVVVTLVVVVALVVVALVVVALVVVVVVVNRQSLLVDSLSLLLSLSLLSDEEDS